jgi:phospholipase C
MTARDPANSPLPHIEHVVVLMLENRSYDHLFAFLDGAPDFDPGQYPNRADPTDPHSVVFVTADAQHRLEKDPPHSHKAVTEQLSLTPVGRARMTGFITAFTRKILAGEERPIVHWGHIGISAGLIMALIGAIKVLRSTPVVTVMAKVFAAWAALAILLTVLRRRVDALPRPTAEERAAAEAIARRIMTCMAPDKIPVLARLAKEFVRCTAWHSSVPGETWPNRNFLHAGTSNGTVEIEVGLYDDCTIFELLEKHGRSWRIYYDGGIPHIWVFHNLWDQDNRKANWFLFHGVDGDEREPGFEAHVQKGKIANYTFIEPRHQAPGSNSQHPGNNRAPVEQGASDFERGEQLVARVYQSLRSKPAVFNKTLLVVTYDEHGGWFDHVSPPPCIAPSPLTDRPSWTVRLVAWFIERRQQHFDFRRLGVRVPALLISPWLDPGEDPTVYDHTSVIATLRALFAPQAAPLTAREEKANTFSKLLMRRTSPRPINDLPDLSDLLATEDERLLVATPSEPPELREVASLRSEDDFFRQLGQLAGKVSERLPPADDAIRLRAAAGDPRMARDPHADVVARFSNAAAAARQL